MKILTLALLVFLSTTSAYAFPLADINFHCPNPSAGVLLQIPLNYDSATNSWTGKLVERDVSVGPVMAVYDENMNRMELSLSSGIIGLMTQSGEHSSIYKDGRFILNCSF